MKSSEEKHKISGASLVTAGLVGVTTTTGLVLASTFVSADDVVDDVAITVPISCTMSGTGMNTHTAEVVNGTYEANFGTTTMKVLCNDNSGFSIYATGFTNETIGETNSNKLVGTNASGNATIDTGIAQSGNTSNWAMKLATNSQATYPITITSDTEGPFSSYHTVPSTWTKVATRLAGTDIGAVAEGSTITSTYAAYINSTQPADTYTGKVKYTLVHPNDGAAPIVPPPAPTDCSTPVPNLTYMQDLNNSNKATVLSSMTEDSQYYLRDKRDEKPYCVAKLKDGNIWMTQNLDHDIKTDGSVAYTPATTDVPETWTPSTATYPTSTTTWNGSTTAPESYDRGELYWSGIPGDSAPASTGNSHYHVGISYNWTAAVAMNDSSSYTTQYQDVNQSICPANWTLPKSGNVTSSGSFQYLVTQYGWDSSSVKMENPNIWDSPIKASLNASWNGWVGNFGTSGFLWSSMVFDSGYSYLLFISDSGFVVPGNDYARYVGANVRCVAR